MDDYDIELMQEGYRLLTRKNPRFPAKFNKKMKMDLYNKVMDYYKTQEKFEYCIQLSQSLKELTNEDSSK